MRPFQQPLCRLLGRLVPVALVSSVPLPWRSLCVQIAVRRSQLSNNKAEDVQDAMQAYGTSQPDQAGVQ